MADPTVKKWYFHLNKENQGPFSFNELQIRVQNGVVDPTTPFWAEGMAAWSLASKIPDLVNLFTLGAATAFPSSMPTVGNNLSGNTNARGGGGGAQPLSQAQQSTQTYQVQGQSKNQASFSSGRPGNMAESRPAQQSPEEMSMLMELRPNEVDDRTEAIDRTKLKKATKEAAKAHSADARAKIVFNASVHKGRYFFIILLLVGAGVGGVYVVKENKYKEIISFDFRSWFSRLMSSLPALDDVKTADFEILKKAAGESLAKAGPQIAIVMASKGAPAEVLGHPIFYVATNLPDGVNLNFFLHANPQTLLTPQNIDIRFPMAIAQSYAKSPAVHTLEGGSLPIGEYQVTVVEDEEQTVGIKKLLGTMVAANVAVPPYVPAGKKIVAVKTMFLGGEKNDAYNSQLQSAHDALKIQMQNEAKVYSTYVAQVEDALGSLQSTMEQIKKTGRPKSREKIWSDYEKRWQAPALDTPQLNKDSAPFKASAELPPNLQIIFEQMRSFSLGSNYNLPSTDPKSPPPAPRAIMESDLVSSIALLRQKISELRSKIDEISKASS